MDGAAFELGIIARISPKKITPLIPLLIKDLYSHKDRIKRRGMEDLIASGSAIAMLKNWRIQLGDLRSKN
jgi:hypothetical protein